VRSGWEWVADVASARGRVVGSLATRRVWGWVRHHPWDASLMLRVLDTARDPRVSATAARLLETTWTSGGMRGDLHRAISSHLVPYAPRPHTHLARRVVYAHFSGDAAECRRLDPDRRILDHCLGHDRTSRWYEEAEQRWTVDAERERLLAARRRSPSFGGGSGGSGSSGGGGRGVPGSGYGGQGFGGSF
jgi:uncharacterized membrane protein YgcG